MHVLALQHDIVWEDKPANHAAVDRMLDAARPSPGTLVVLAELFDTGFTLEVDAVADGRSIAWAQQAARSRGLHVVCGHADRVEATQGASAVPCGRNCMTVVGATGAIRGRYEKVHPFSLGRENERYARGSRLLLRRIETSAGHMTICPMICYDLRFPELWRLAALAGAEVFTIGASWPKIRQHHWRSLCIARAIENQAYVVAVNRIGRDPSLEYAGGSMVVGPRGEVLAEATDTTAALAATLDLTALRTWRAEFPALRDAHRSLLGAIDLDDDRLDRALNGR